MTTDTILQDPIEDRMHRSQAERIDQYTFWQILSNEVLVDRLADARQSQFKQRCQDW